jgi:uncharacterized protein (DUF2225 family)
LDFSNLNPLYDKKVRCPYCGTAFTSKKVRSRFIKPVKVERDFGPIFQDGEENNPLYYYVAVCPECGYSFTEDFATYIGQEAQKKIEREIMAKVNNVPDLSGKRDFAKAVRAYKLAIYAGTLAQEKHFVMAKLCLRLAWLNRGVANKEEELRFLQLATSEYEQSYLHTDFDPEVTPEISVLYLIGELNRRLGKYNEAIQYFTAVAEHPDRSKYRKYVTFAREQWQVAVQENREKRGIK